MNHLTPGMKNPLLATPAVAVLVLSWIATANGQQSSSIDIRVSATVIESIELVTLRNMRFGSVQPGQKEITISPVIDSGAGKMLAKGMPNTQIRVSYIKEWQLVNDRTGGTLTFYYNLAGNTEDNQYTAELLQSDNRGLQFNDDGEYFLWIGGRVNIENAQPGNYEGEFTIEIEYI